MLSYRPGVAENLEISPKDVDDRRRAGGIQLVDVREPYEWEAGRIAGARHIELQSVAAQAPTIDRERPVVFYCRVGARSAMAAGAFRRAGYDAYSMAGGIEAWADKGLPLEPEDGEVAPH
jgi:hydroxyacylglutathione hydrolase/adenylyltransferase/sulfurtransferase